MSLGLCPIASPDHSLGGVLSPATCSFGLPGAVSFLSHSVQRRN